MTVSDIAALIAELKELKERATPGTWKLWGGDVMADTKGTSDVKDAELVCRCPLKPNEYGGSQVRDAYYIAAMQRAMPALLRHIEDLTSERDATRAALDRATGPYVLDKEASESALRVIAEAQTARADKAEAELAAERGRRERAETDCNHNAQLADGYLSQLGAAEARVKDLTRVVELQRGELLARGSTAEENRGRTLDAEARVRELEAEKLALLGALTEREDRLARVRAETWEEAIQLAQAIRKRAQQEGAAAATVAMSDSGLSAESQAASLDGHHSPTAVDARLPLSDIAAGRVLAATAPGVGGERKTWEGVVVHTVEANWDWYGVAPPDALDNAFGDTDWLGGHEGKCVRLTVEVLPDAPTSAPAVPSCRDALSSLLAALEDVPVAFGVHVHDAVAAAERALAATAPGVGGDTEPLSAWLPKK